MTEPSHKNVLYYGDNLDILRRYVKDETVDLIYLDPPFKSNQDYNILFAERDGTQAAAQIKAFEDTWHWDMSAAEAFEDVIKQGGKVAQAMVAFRTFLGENDMLAYLAMMAPRLVELRRVLKPTGSIYLHCDPTASHYLKMLLDAVFGSKQFLNEVIWHYGPKATQRTISFQRKHDIILLYVKHQGHHVFTSPLQEYGEGSLAERDTRYKNEDESGKYRLTTRRDNQGNKYRAKVYLRDGVVMTDVWGIPIINATAKERLGYPTQKPEALLERIIRASSKEGDLVLDPFCGCGTTVAVAQRLKRRWIGIDITHLAVNLIRRRLRDAYGADIIKTFKVIGEPVSVQDAETLAASDQYQFQWWALGLVGARPAEGKKGADKGIDGRIYFHDDPKGATKQIVISVKAGKLQAAYVRDIRGVMDREKAEISVLISMGEPTKQMRTEAATAGFYDSPYGKRYPRLQLLTVGELLAGKDIDYPPSSHKQDVTFKQAPKVKAKPETPSLFKK